MKKLGIGFLSLIVLLGIAIVAVPRLIDWNGYKADIAAAVKDATGRDLAIAGDIEVSILPDITFALSGVTLSNAEGAAEPKMFALESVRGRLALFPLISRNVIVEELVIRAPVLHLAVDEAGRPNWAFEGAKPSAAEPETGTNGLPFSGLTLENVRLEEGQVSFHDARSGQRVAAKAINLEVALAALSAPLTLRGDLIVNDDPVVVELSLDSPGGLLSGSRAAVATVVEAAHIKLNYEGGLRQSPTPSVDGTFALAIPSVGQFAAWLKRPLAEGQPDPGPIEVRAVFESEGATVTLKEATIDGDALHIKASGGIDGSGAVKRVSFNLETSVVDLDRYLPPPVESALTAPETKPRRDLFEAISDAPFDLSPFRQTEAEINIAVAGVRALGYRVGKIAFKAELRGGVLNAELNELGLYGGGVTGALRFDGAGDALGVTTTLKIDKVDVGALARAARGDQAKVAGIASGRLTAKGQGKSPRALAQSLVASATVSLGGVNVKDAPGAISKLELSVDFPGVDANPSVQAKLVYNNEPVAVSFTLDPLPKVLSGDRFETRLDVKSRRVNLNYEGAVQIEPVPGLAGRFALDVPSVGKLLRWLEHPLPKGQPDPGPLKIKAVMTADGAKISLTEALIDGASLKAKATGSFDGSGDVAKFALDLEAGILDIDRYLPPMAKNTEPAGPAPASDDILAALPDEPFDLTPLQNAEGRVSVRVLGLKAMGYELGEIVLAANLKDGVLDAQLDKFRLYGGGITGTVKLDGAGDALGVDAALTLDRVDIGRLAPAAQGAGVASGTVRATARGKSPRELAAGLNANATLELTGIALEAARPLSAATLAIDTGGLEGPTAIKGSVVYNEKQVAFDVAVAALKPALAGKAVDLTAEVTSDLLTARYSGKVQSSPVPGLGGNLDLDIPSVGRLLAWLDNPLPKDQPDPGPLSVKAAMTSDGAKLALEEAVIEGKALKARASARLDVGQAVKRFEVNVEIDEADLNAYLPPGKQTEAKARTAKPPQPSKPSRWSEEPFDVSPLHQAEGRATVRIGRVRYRDLEVTQGVASVTLDNGVLTAVVDGLRLAGGGVDLRATIDASGRIPAIDYRVNVVGVQARPLLKTFAGTDRLSGATALSATGTARGVSERRMVETLNGNGNIRFTNGAIHGINIAQMLRKAQTLGLGSAGEQKTDFAELSGSFTITNGVLDNRDLKLLAPVLRVTGKGRVPMPPRTIDYEVEAKLVASLQGQGGSDALAGLPIPITVKGSWDDPSIATDWRSVFALASAIPGRIADMPAGLLDFGKSLGVPLAIPGLTSGDDKSGGVGGILGGILKAIPGISGSQPPQTEQPAQEQPAQEQPRQTIPNPLNTLRKLFGN